MGDVSSVSKKEEQLGSKEKVRKFSPKGETKQLGVILVIQEKERTVGVSTCQSSDKKKGQLGSPLVSRLTKRKDSWGLLFSLALNKKEQSGSRLPDLVKGRNTFNDLCAM